MRIDELSLKNVRNHIQSELELSQGLNIFHGLNGAGKTSVLESLAICSFSKSFMPAPDASIVRSGAEFYSASAKCTSDLNMPYSVSIRYTPGSKKAISGSIGENLNPKDIIGEIPIVILSPDYKSITFGVPDDRRKFIDSILSQSGKRYMDHLFALKRCLKQRNSLLTTGRKDYTFDYSLVEPWTEMLITTAIEVTLRRKKFIEEFKPYFKSAYTLLGASEENVDIEYCPYGLDSDFIALAENREEFANRYRAFAKSFKQDEYRRGTTLFGPQKDELKIWINGGLAKEYASQGQHKSLLISLKFAEFTYLKKY